MPHSITGLALQYKMQVFTLYGKSHPLDPFFCSAYDTVLKRTLCSASKKISGQFLHFKFVTLTQRLDSMQIATGDKKIPTFVSTKLIQKVSTSSIFCHLLKPNKTALSLHIWTSNRFSLKTCRSYNTSNFSLIKDMTAT